MFGFIHKLFAGTEAVSGDDQPKYDWLYTSEALSREGEITNQIGDWICDRAVVLARLRNSTDHAGVILVEDCDITGAAVDILKFITPESITINAEGAHITDCQIYTCKSGLKTDWGYDESGIPGH